VSSDKVRNPYLSAIYQQYLEDQDAGLFISKVSRCYTQGTLERLVVHPRREVRRAAVLALGSLGDYNANHCLGRALLDEDRAVRTLAENSIRSVWCRVGSEEHCRELGVVMRLCGAKQYQQAAEQATELIAKAPWVGEAWYQRALAHFHLRRFAEAIRDGHEALEVNPYHFLAAAIMGQAYLALGNNVSALESFRRALRLNPDLESVRGHVVRLARTVEDA